MHKEKSPPLACRAPGRRRAVAGIIAVLLSIQGASASGPPGNGWVMAWSDEFNGSSVDTSKWTVGTGNRRNAVNTANALTVANGHLRIQTYTEGGTHYTGWIGSHGKFEDCFGYWEARIRFNSSAGMWSAFWLQPHGINNIGNPAAHGTEIDIVEHRSRDSGGADLRNRAAINVHWDGYGSQQKTVGTVVNNPGANPASLQGNWHTYGLLWEPGRYRFYIDGVEVWSTTAAISQVRQWIYLTSEVQNNAWAGPIPSGGYGSRSTSNTYMDVDYVRVYHRAEQVTNSHFGHRLGPWRQQGGTGWSSNGGRDGGGAGYLNPTSSGGARIEQTVFGLLPNTPYLVRGWARIDHDDPGWSAPVRIGARHFGGSEEWSPVSTRSFSATEVPFTTGPSHSRASVFGHAPTTWTKSFIDDITVSRAGRFTNGGFELGDAAHWHTYGDAFVHAWSAAFRRSGLQAARLNTSNNARGFEQTIRGLKPATSYTVSMWHKGNSQPVRLGVKNHGDGESFTSSTASGGNWRRATHTFTTGASATAATVFAMIPAGSNIAAVDIDDFLISEGTVSGWTSTDIGSGALPGESAMSDGALVLRGAGNNLGGSAGDALRFLHQPFDGVGHITARLNSFEAGHDRAKAGVMIRSTTADNAPFAMVHWLPEGRVEFLHRPTAGAPSAHVWSSATVAWPPHLRLNRPVPGMVAAQYSTDGTTWIDVGTPQPVDLPDEALAGPAVTSHESASTGEAVFGAVELFAVPADLDSDGDGLTDIEEDLLGTDPLTPNHEIVWWPDGTPGGAGNWHAAAAWRLGAATTAWTSGRTALFAVAPGTVTADAPVAGLEGLTFNVASYHLAGSGPLAFGATNADIRLPGDGTTTITTPVSGTGILTANGGGRLDLRGDNRAFTGTLALRDGVQLRPYHSGDGSATGHETGGAETTIDVGDGSQIRWFNPAADATYASVFTIAGPSAPLANPGALNLDASQARTTTLTGPVTTAAPATIGTQNNGRFVIEGPLTGAHPLNINLGNAVTTLAGVVDLPAITRSGGGTLAIAETAALTLPTLVHQGGGYRFDSGTTAGIGAIELEAALTLDVADLLEVPSAIDGTGNLVKTGAGTLVLAGPNTFGSGTLTHGSGTTNRGFLRLTHPQALGGHSTLHLASSQGGVSGAEITGGITVSQHLLTAGRQQATDTGFILRNLDGENTWSGDITITAGGGSYAILSDAGNLALSGTVSSSVESNQFGARALQFSGAGDITITGSLVRAGDFAMQDLAVSKSGTGTLTLAGISDYTGPTTATAGTLQIDGTLAASHVTVGENATLTGSGSIPAATVQGTLALDAGRTFTITGPLALEDATLAISGMPAGPSPVILATHGSLTGSFAAITGVPDGWDIETNHAGGTAIALVAAAVPAGFDSWAATHLGGQGPDDDFHGDGIPNLLRYALDIDPAKPSGFPGSFANGTLTFHKRPEAVANGDITYTIESSPDLSPGSWTPAIADLDDDHAISITSPVDGPRLFLRLAVQWSE